LSGLKIVVTGSDGFVGRNLCTRLAELGHRDLFAWSRATPAAAAAAALAAADFVFHLAGVNRPPAAEEFTAGNVGFTALLTDALRSCGRSTPIVYASSIQADRDNPYGRSKAAAEQVLVDYARDTGAWVRNLRLQNIFGKWSRPNYNSVVSTYCHNIARDLPIRIDDPAAPLTLVHVDAVVEAMTAFLESPAAGDRLVESMPVYHTSVAALAAELASFRQGRTSLAMGAVGTGFLRALYATYVSYLPPAEFSYSIPSYSDPRGTFAEMLKTPDCGQFSYFTAHPGVTRGGHYHHTKTEKFLVIRGQARFRFRHIVTGEKCELTTSGESPRIVETVPGWAHDITNVGADEMIVMLWANEVFDRSRPDTFKHAV
jgi:UDP-2-acetamido-2,6-beta-L-arabino-hexul-4-ose reductase